MRKIFITGASRGIGREIAIGLARENDNLFLTSRDIKRLEELRGELIKRRCKVTFLTGDLKDNEFLKILVDKVLDYFGGSLDVLVLNAGLAHVKPCIETNMDEFDEQFLVNVRAPFFLVRHLYKFINPGGHVIFIGSIASQRVFPNWGIYASTKFAIRAIALALRQELKSKKVHVTLINPGAVDTDIWKNVEDPLKDFRLRGEDIGRLVRYVLDEPYHVDLEEITITPFER